MVVFLVTFKRLGLYRRSKTFKIYDIVGQIKLKHLADPAGPSSPVVIDFFYKELSRVLRNKNTERNRTRNSKLFERSIVKIELRYRML